MQRCKTRARWNAGSAPKFDDKDMKSQSRSAVEIHPLPARRPGMGRRFAHCHNTLKRRDFLRSSKKRRKS